MGKDRVGYFRIYPESRLKKTFAKIEKRNHYVLSKIHVCTRGELLLIETMKKSTTKRAEFDRRKKTVNVDFSLNNTIVCVCVCYF